MLESSPVSIVMQAYLATRTFASAKRLLEYNPFWISALQPISVDRHQPTATPLACYRTHSEPCSSNKAHNLPWHIYRNELGLSILQSAWLMMTYETKPLLKRPGSAVGIDYAGS